MMTLVLAVVMVLSMSAMVFAEGDETPAATKNDSITVNSTKSGETYKIYKLMDLKVNSEESPTAYSYTINSTWSAFFAQEDVAALITKNNAGYVTAVSDAESLAKKAAAYAKENNISATDTKEASGTSVSFTGLADGYWLITSTLGTKAMIETTPDASAVSVNEKNPEDTIEKKVQEGGNYGTENDAQVGDTVNFQSTVTLVPGTRNVKVHDTMDEGLTFSGNNSITISGGTPAITAAGYEILETPESGDTFTIKFTDAYINSLTDTATITITYTATLNEKAVSSTPGLVDQKNKTKVSYGDKQSKESETTTKTHKFSIFKHATGATTNLAGAVFEVKKSGTILNLTKIDDNNYKVDPNGSVTQFTTNDSGDIVIWGVDSGSGYTLNEVNPPDGYNALTEEVTVTVNADNDTRADVENKSGTELPSTGGIGTTIFYILGSILVIGGGIMLISRKRLQK